MRLFSIIAVALVCVPLCLAGDLAVNPTTTLWAQTSNNTGAANSFQTQSNGNLGASNISKVDTHSLLYAGADTKIFAHLELWWGVAGHSNIGYSSLDAAHVKQQIEDMISRGIDGVVMVWYGPNNPIDQAAQLVMKEAELHPGFTFALMVDHGAIQWDSCAGCSPQDALIAQLKYIEQTFFPSTAYLRINSQPVITDFDIDLFYQVDWNAVKSALSTTPAFMFQNNGGFNHAASDGAYSWVIPTTNDYGASYLASFYSTGDQFPAEQTWGASYKGFNDTLASWGMHRIMNQQCGQTWLQTFSDINKVYNSKHPLPAMQLVTWNDYEEGTEIESGIDNCLSVSASVSGNSLQWKVNGNENTVDHYTAYVSTDGQNLAKLADMATNSQSLDLCASALPAGNYTLYVQAVGKPSLKNQMSKAIPYSASCPVPPAPTPSPSPAPSLTLTASPSSVSVTPGQAVTAKIVVASKSGPFDNPVSLSCSNPPPGLSCTFSPASVTPGSGAVSSLLTFSTTTAFASLKAPLPSRGSPVFPPYMLGFAVMGIALTGGIDKKRAIKVLALASLICALLLLSSCGGGSAATTKAVSPQSTPVTVTINGTSGATQTSTSVSITIQ
jgi:hypothetical protein